MQRIIIIDQRTNFPSDVMNKIVINDEYDLEIVGSATDASDLDNMIKKFNPTVVAVCENAKDTVENWDYDIPVVGYALSPNRVNAFDDIGVHCIGYVTSAKGFITIIKRPIPEKTKKTPASTKSEVNSSAEKIDNSQNDNNINNKQINNTNHSEEKQKNNPELSEEEKFRKEFEEFKAFKAAQEKAKAEKQQKAVPEFLNKSSENKSDSVFSDENQNNDLKKAAKERSQYVQGKKKAEKQVQKDVSNVRKKAKTISVYAAKGGVGKTTIATEVATYLALTAHGRGRYKVCIVDFNIDFGDVRSTLGLDSDSPCMYEWALDIAERIERGENPEEIKYNKTEISRYLQVVEKSGLYALCAPVKHEESADIEHEELNIMLRNIIYNGGFDFVICDTGNNTRDSSVEAYRQSDSVLLLATQDATTGICNASLCEALEAFGFSLDKIKLVVNNAMSARSTGVDVQEVIDYFPYDCIAVIKHDTDITKANNLSEPIVYQANHPVTKELKKIVSFITGGPTESVQPKKSIFSFFKKK